MTSTATVARQTDVLHGGGLNYASEKAVVEQVLGRRTGVISARQSRSRKPQPSCTTRPRASRGCASGSGSAGISAPVSRYRGTCAIGRSRPNHRLIERIGVTSDGLGVRAAELAGEGRKRLRLPHPREAEPADPPEVLHAN